MKQVPVPASQRIALMQFLGHPSSLLVDLYELTMGQVYFNKESNDLASFEVSIRELPKDWGFFVMAGLDEVLEFVNSFCFSPDEVQWLETTRLFSHDFLRYLAELKIALTIRSLPEGRIFFPREPVLEIRGPLIDVQLLESYVLNILGYSILAASLAARTVLAANDKPVFDFGLRRAHGPDAALRAARAGQIAGFSGTSNCFAGRHLGLALSGTMAHSFVQIHLLEEEAFLDFIETYRENSVLIVDTYDPHEGICRAASVARSMHLTRGLKIKGIRIDSGNLLELSRFARACFIEQNVEFLKIFVSGGLDEFTIRNLLDEGAEIDGFGVGTRYVTSHYAPNLDIVYKLIEYAGRLTHKASPEKSTIPGRKSIQRIQSTWMEKDLVCPFDTVPDSMVECKVPEDMAAIKKRFSGDLARLPDSLKRIVRPSRYPVEFRM
jgi:nicotinate phosphoribosyltransferase